MSASTFASSEAITACCCKQRCASALSSSFMVLSCADGWGESLHRKPQSRAAISSPHGQSAQRSLRQQAPFSSLKACHQAVASLQRACGLFLDWLAGVHVQQSLFFAHRRLSVAVRESRTSADKP